MKTSQTGQKTARLKLRFKLNDPVFIDEIFELIHESEDLYQHLAAARKHFGNIGVLEAEIYKPEAKAISQSSLFE